jgi:hypothetical protein
MTTSFSNACVCPSSNRLCDGRPADPMPTPLRSTTSLMRTEIGRRADLSTGSVSRYRRNASSTSARLVWSISNTPSPRENRRS